MKTTFLLQNGNCVWREQKSEDNSVHVSIEIGENQPLKLTGKNLEEFWRMAVQVMRIRSNE